MFKYKLKLEYIITTIFISAIIIFTNISNPFTDMIVTLPGVIVFGAGLFIAAKLFKQLNNNSGITLIELKESQILSCIDSLIQQATLFNIPCPLRKAIFKDMLVSKFKSAYDIISNIINDEDVAKYKDNAAFTVRMRRFMDELHISEIKEYEKLKIPDLVIDKFYSEMNAYKIDCNAAVVAICRDSVAYNNNYERLHAILWILLEMVKAEFEHLRNALMSLNGDISSIKYTPADKKIEVSYQDCDCNYCSCREQDIKARLSKQIISDNSNCNLCKDKHCALKHIDMTKLKKYSIDQLTSFVDRHIACVAKRSAESTQIILKMATDNIIRDISNGLSMDQLSTKYPAFKSEVLSDYINQHKK